MRLATSVLERNLQIFTKVKPSALVVVVFFFFRVYGEEVHHFLVRGSVGSTLPDDIVAGFVRNDFYHQLKRFDFAVNSGGYQDCQPLPSLTGCSNALAIFKWQNASYDVGRDDADEIFPAKKEHLLQSSIRDIFGPGSGNVKNELLMLALPAIFGQAMEPLAQLLETAYIGRLGPVELASAGVSVSIFNIISKLFNLPLLSITTSFVAEDISRNANAGYSSASGIGVVEALALYFGAGLFINIMGITAASPMFGPAKKFLSLRAVGAPAVVVSLAVQGIFRGFKDTRTPVLCVGKYLMYFAAK
ncbi:hypothetical protein ACLOJK_039681 [Asimina triloba]